MAGSVGPARYNPASDWNRSRRGGCEGGLRRSVEPRSAVPGVWIGPGWLPLTDMADGRPCTGKDHGDAEHNSSGRGRDSGVGADGPWAG
ncbi:MAG TPA: hypothetical protein ENN87_05430 [Phycisphaerales bacterium]|nr:hypothetical protein [Phycisphaerales bacterium]